MLQSRSSAPSDAGHVGEQHAAYRKGLIVGLTMAEVGILIIFVLLLLVGYQHIQQMRILRQLQGKVAVDRARLTELTEADDTVKAIAAALGIDVKRPRDDFRRLVRVVQSATATAAGRRALAQSNQALEEIQDAEKQMQALAAVGNKDGEQALAKQLEAQSYRIANQEGQLKRYESQLQAAGQGKGQRPCWVERDGTIDYLYDVALESNGIRMKERTYAARARERAQLPLPVTSPDETLTQSEFLRRTEALFHYSQTLNCRFFVVVYDATARQEKPLYKSELRAVEGHFYKLLSNASPPF